MVSSASRQPTEMSEVPLPPGWDLVRLGDVAQLTRGVSWRKSEESKSGIPVVTIPNVRDGKVNFDVQYHLAKYVGADRILREGDILLVGSSGSAHNVGRTAVVPRPPKDATFASFLVRAKPESERLDRTFLAFLLSSPVVDFRALSKRAADGKFNLQVHQLREHRIPLPPLSVQLAIASVLRSVQQAIYSTEKVILATAEVKRSLVRHLFTYGPVAIERAANAQLQETDIGPMPAHWRIAALGSIVDVKGGKRLPKGHAFSLARTPYPYVRVVDFEDGSVNTAGLKFLTDTDHLTLARYTISSEDVYISIAGTIGSVGRIPPQLDGAHLTENAAKLVITRREALDPDFLVAFLASEVGRRQIQALTGKTSQPKLALGRIMQIMLPLPDAEEQRRIAKFLSAISTKMRVEEKRRHNLTVVADTLLRDLVTGRRRIPQFEVA